MRLEGRAALVTGGAHRLGRSMALALAESGANVFIHYGSSEEEARQTVREVRALGVAASLGQADLVQAEDIQALVGQATEDLGPISILVSNAARFSAESFGGTAVETFDAEFAVNLRAPFFLAQAFARALPVEEEGAIVHLSDARVNRPLGDHFAYRLTKAGLNHLTRQLALELAPRIRVNALALGAILPPSHEDEAYLQRLREQIPLGRTGDPKTVTDNLIHLLRQDFLTGVVLPLDGGQFL